MSFPIKKFFSYYKPYLGLYLLVLACALIASTVDLVFPLLVRYITKDVLEGDLTTALSKVYWIGGLMLILVAIKNIGNFFVDYKGHEVGARIESDLRGFQRFMEIMNLKPAIENKLNAITLTDVYGEIEFKQVSFSYGEQMNDILVNLSLRVKPGEYIALVGPSGAGKTTLCSLIPRFYDVSDGEVLLDGINVRDINLQLLRKIIGIVQQDVYIFAGTVMENIRYGNPTASDEEIFVAAKQANAHEFIMSLPNGYQSEIGQRGVRLSGGQKQRLSIARVFLKNPPVLILDDATSALDNESESIIKQSLESLAKGRTTIVIAHRLSTIRNAGRIIVLTEEGIVEQGTHEALLAHDGAYAQLYSKQFELQV